MPWRCCEASLSRTHLLDACHTPLRPRALNPLPSRRGVWEGVEGGIAMQPEAVPTLAGALFNRSARLLCASLSRISFSCR